MLALSKKSFSQESLTTCDQALIATAANGHFVLFEKLYEYLRQFPFTFDNVLVEGLYKAALNGHVAMVGRILKLILANQQKSTAVVRRVEERIRAILEKDVPDEERNKLSLVLRYLQEAASEPALPSIDQGLINALAELIPTVPARWLTSIMGNSL